jgi:hypothetical protein
VRFLFVEEVTPVLGSALKLLAVGEASRQVGGYVNNLARRYLILMIASAMFLSACAFGMLALYWSLIFQNLTPVQASCAIACGLLLIAFLTALAAYGTTRASKPAPLLENESVTKIPALAELTAEDVGHQIELAVAKYGAAKVVAFAALGGVVAGILTRRMPPSEI